jgi:hypothetical protein
MSTEPRTTADTMPPSGWTWLDNGAIERIAEIGPAAFAVYVLLSRFANADRQSWPSAGTIMRYTGLCKRSVWRAIAVLKDANLLSVESIVQATGRYANNRYTLLPLAISDKKAPRCISDTRDSDKKAPGDSDKKAPLTRLTLSRLTNTNTLSSAEADIPADLLKLIDGWNSLGAGIVASGNGARRDPPAKAVLSGWKQAMKDREQREHFQNIPAILAKIREASYLHGQGFFSLPWLFGRNKKRELVIERLMAGAYIGANGNGKPYNVPGPGARHPDDADGPL